MKKFYPVSTDHTSEITLSTPETQQVSTPVETTPVVPVLSPTGLLWDTPVNARHSVRVLCDNHGLSIPDKNIITAVIHGESAFYNTAKNYNKNAKGVVTSTDWGICQINDRFHIGPNSDFPSVQYVLDNPDKAVEWMIRMFKLGHINWWCAYANGSYKQWLA